MKSISFRFNIRPKPKQSVRGGKYGFYKDPKVKAYEEALKDMAKPQIKGTYLEGSVKFSVTYSFKAPKSTPKTLMNIIENGGKVYKQRSCRRYSSTYYER
jgi:Holliday junction resolvase RusA-like endonuclease